MPSLLKNLVLSAALAAAAQAAWVPATVSHIEGSSGNGKRSVNDLEALKKAMEPTDQANLLYIDDAHPTQNMAINVNAAHDQNKYIVLEEFRSLIKQLTCTPNPANKNETNVGLKFDDEDAYRAAKTLWATDEELKDGKFLFVTSDKDCSPDGDRKIFMSDKVQFDDSKCSATISSKPVVLGGCPEASSSLTVTGGPYKQQMQKREAFDLGSLTSIIAPIQSTVQQVTAPIESTVQQVTKPIESVVSSVSGFGGASGQKSATLPLDLSAKDATIINTDMLRLTCNDCHLTGELTPAFKYKFGTVGDIVKLFDSGDLKSIVQEVEFDVSATKDISAGIDFSVHTTQSASFTCSYPFGTCGVAIDGISLGAKEKSMLGDKGFQIGPISLNLFAGLGIMIDANIQANIGMNWTSSMTMPSGQADVINFLDLGKSSAGFSPQFQASKPTVEVEDVKACISLGLGGAFQAGAAIDIPIKGSQTLFDSNIDVYLPKFTYCAEDNKKSSDDCQADGAAHTHHFSADALVGLGMSGAVVTAHVDLGDRLQHTFNVYDKCDLVDAPETTGPVDEETTDEQPATEADKTSGAATPTPAAYAAPTPAQKRTVADRRRAMRVARYARD